MDWHLNGYAVSLIVCGLICAAIGVYTWQRRQAIGLTWLALMMWAVAVWSFGYGMELASGTLAAMMFWLRVEYVGITALPVVWIGFVTAYTSHTFQLTWRRVAMLSIIPAVSLLMHWSNDLHRLYYTSLAVDASGPFHVLAVTRGPWYWFYVAYFYLVFFVGMVIVGRFYGRARGLYRAQGGVILAAALVPWVANMLYMAGLSPLPHLDLTPFAFTLTIAAIAWGLFRAHFLDVVPVARDKVVESIGEAIFVLDRKSRLVDVNPAGQRLIGRSNGEALGLSLNDALTGWPDLLKHYAHLGETEAHIVSPDGQHTYHLRVFPLCGLRDEIEGRLIVLHDITEHIKTEQSMREAKEAAEASNRAKSIFLSSLSHEFRTPLNVILGFGQLIVNDGNLTPRQREGLEMINSSGEQLLGLVNGLLEMIKDEAAQSEQLMQELDRLLNEQATQPTSDGSLTKPAELVKAGIFDASLAGLPPELLTALEEVAIRLDMDAVNHLIEEIGGYSSAAAIVFDSLARNFKYEEISALCHEANRRLSN